MLRSHTESVRGGAYTPVRRHCLLRSSSALACVRHMQHVQTRLAKAACLNMMTLMWHTLSRSCSGCRCAPARPSVISAGAVERLPSSRRRAAAERLGWPTRRTRHTSGRLFRGGSWRSGWLPGCLACAARQRSDTSCVACRASSEAEFTARRAPQVRTAEYAVCRSFAACGQQGLLCSGAVPPCMADLPTMSQEHGQRPAVREGVCPSNMAAAGHAGGRPECSASTCSERLWSSASSGWSASRNTRSKRDSIAPLMRRFSCTACAGRARVGCSTLRRLAGRACQCAGQDERRAASRRAHCLLIRCTFDAALGCWSACG